MKLIRFGVSIPKSLSKKFDELIKNRKYSSRSEAIRDLVRDRLVQTSWEEGDEEMVGTITLVYNHHQRELTEKLTAQQHDFHHAILSAMHVHLDHHNRVIRNRMLQKQYTSHLLYVVFA